MEEKVDVLLATYNGEKYLKKQIDSILNQTYKNINLIISDDCSSDGTREILKDYEEKDKRIKVYYQKENKGVVNNFEFLLEHVENEFYMLSDQDDIWLPEKIEKSIKKIKEDNADLVFGDLEIVDEQLNTINKSFCKCMKLDNKIKKCINTYKLEYLYNCITGCTIISKKKYINDILPIPKESEHIIHDHWIGLIVLLKGGKVSFLNKTYIKYRQHSDNQVGIEKKSYNMKKFEDVRKLFIDVKKGVFSTYVKNNEKFPEELQKLNQKALEYYTILENKKNINFRYWSSFHKLYSNENIVYYLENFVILNTPILAKVIFKIAVLVKLPQIL